MAQWQHLGSKEFWPSVTVHCALEGLQAIDMALSLTVTPRQFDGILHGLDVAVQRSGKARDWRDFRLDGRVDPCV